MMCFIEKYKKAIALRGLVMTRVHMQNVVYSIIYAGPVHAYLLISGSCRSDTSYIL